MKITPWTSFLELYDLEFNPDPAKVRLNRREAYSTILQQAGIYRIIDITIPGLPLIYIGQAGGRGGESHFDARIRKHGFKALGVTSKTVCSIGIADTKRWAQYRKDYLIRTNAKDLSCILLGWRVSFLILPNSTEDQRRFIDLMEQVAGLVFDRESHVAAKDLILPHCNSQQLANPLLALFTHPQSAHEVRTVEMPLLDQAFPSQPNALVSTLEYSVLNLEEQMEPTDIDDWRDDAFISTFQTPNVQRPLYTALLNEIRMICAESHAREVGLKMTYTNTDSRDLRVTGSFNCFKVLMRIHQRGDGFKVYLRLDPERAELRGLHPRFEAHGQQRSSFQLGNSWKEQHGCNVSDIGRALRLALVIAQMPRASNP